MLDPIHLSVTARLPSIQRLWAALPQDDSPRSLPEVPRPQLCLSWGLQDSGSPRELPGTAETHQDCDLELQLLPHQANPLLPPPPGGLLASSLFRPGRTAGFRDSGCSFAHFQMQNELLSPVVFGKENRDPLLA